MITMIMTIIITWCIRLCFNTFIICHHDIFSNNGGKLCNLISDLIKDSPEPLEGILLKEKVETFFQNSLGYEWFQIHYIQFTVTRNHDTLTVNIMQYNGTRTQITKFMGPTWGPPGTSRRQLGPMLAPWTLLSGTIFPVRCVGYQSMYT